MSRPRDITEQHQAQVGELHGRGVMVAAPLK